MRAPSTLWQTILVPHDLSPSADHALAIAREQATFHGGRIVLLHVVELPPHFGPDSTLVLPEGHQTPIGIRRFAEITAVEQVTALAERVRQDGLEVSVFVRVGLPVEEIHQFVDEHRADGHPIDIIVMGTHGRTGIRHLVVGSVAERVVRTSTVPVMTIRAAA